MVGICKTALGQTAKKEERKQKILELLKENGELSNAQIREHLGVSRNTAVNYMDQLEKKGKVSQVGESGKYVRYKLKEF